MESIIWRQGNDPRNHWSDSWNNDFTCSCKRYDFRGKELMGLKDIPILTLLLTALSASLVATIGFMIFTWGQDTLGYIILIMGLIVMIYIVKWNMEGR